MNGNQNYKSNRTLIIACFILSTILICCIGALYYRSQHNSHNNNEGIGDFSLENDNIKKIIIGTWDGGSISVCSSPDGRSIIAKETDADGLSVKSHNKMYYRITGSTLEIKPCVTYISNRLFNRSIEKHMQIELPSCYDYEIILSAKNTDLITKNIFSNGSLRAETVNGQIFVSNCTMDKISVSSSGGKVTAADLSCSSFSCRTSNCSAEAISVTAREYLKLESQKSLINIELSQAPKNSVIHAFEAEVNIVIPGESDFTTCLDLTEANVIYRGWEDAADNSSYYQGNGSAYFEMIARKSLIALNSN